ncbi:MAG: IS200/IS605 family transposase [Erysipelotrichaceae bacterium]|nr:IS200/IS605 family transposase [Erysipelotrichaceae bacterium]
MNNYTSVNRRKYYLKVHLVFVCKYRKQLLANEDIDLKLKCIFKDIESNCDFIIDIMETDKDHIHLLVSYPPKISISSIVRKLKQESTITLWKYFPTYLSKCFWNEHTFWSDGYFVCSIGEANPDTIRKYIENQG